MPTLRQTGGLSGYPSRAESPHDWIENSHASTALSYADGLAKAFAVRDERRPVVAVVGDGALTGGMCWEALNNIAAADRPVVIVVNDNGRSYSPTIGGLAEHLAGLRLRPGYERMLGRVKGALDRTPVVGPPIYDALHGVKRGIKDLRRAAGHVRGPRPEVRRPGRRPRRRRRSRHAFALARGFDGPVHRALRDPQGLRLRAGRERRGRPDAPVARVRPGDRRRAGELAGAPGPACSPTSWCGSASSATTSSRSPRRCASRPGSARSAARFPDRMLRRRHRRAARGRPRPPGSPRAACTRSSRSTRPSSTAPSTRCCSTSRCTGCRSPFVLDRAGITGDDGPSAQRRVGSRRARRGARHPHRRAARRGHAARAAARGGGVRRRPDRRPVPEDAAARADVPAVRSDRRRRRARRARPRRRRRRARRRRRRARRRRAGGRPSRCAGPGSPSGSSTPAGSPRSTRTWCELAGQRPTGRDRRGRQRGRRRRHPDRPGDARRPGSTCADPADRRTGDVSPTTGRSPMSNRGRV